MQEPDFDSVLESVIVRDPRYDRGAYFFVREALDYTQKMLAKARKTAPRHVTGQELLAGVRDYGIHQFGPMTMEVLAEWGIHQGEDIGEIVFNLVDCKLLSKTPEDSKDDFKGGYDFYHTFREPFLPAAKKNRPSSEQPRTPSP